MQLAAERRRVGVDAEHAHYRWWALSCTSLGMLLATLNSGTLIIALPDLERALHTSLLQLVWVILVYMIASTVLLLTAGRLSDLFGRKNAFVAGFVLFSVASLGAGFAGGPTSLILWRILQGIGGAFLFANASALVTDAFPRHQLGLAMGTNVMIAAVGLVLGPVLGGALVAISWHWVFWFNVPLGLAGSIWAWLVLHELAKRDESRGLDLAGSTVFLVGFTGLVLALSKGGLSGWSDPLVLGGFAAAAVLLPVFVLIERRGSAPMLDLELFRDRLFAAAAAAAFLNGLARFALTFIFVFYFQGAAGRFADSRGSRARAARGGDARRLADCGTDRRPSRLARARGARDAAHRARARVDDDAPGAHSVLALGALARARRRRLRDLQQPQHRRDDGRRAGEPARDRRCGTDAVDQRRCGALDRVRARGRHLRRAEGRAVQDLLGARFRPLELRARAVHPQHAHGALGAGGGLAAGRRDLVPATLARGRMRIGEIAERTGTTVRTIRYYEELGLLADPESRAKGSHRVYSGSDVERLEELIRLRELLGVSLEELKTIVEAEEARAALRREWHEGASAERRVAILREALSHVATQLELVRARRLALEGLEAELFAKRRRLNVRLREQARAGSERGTSLSKGE